MLGNEKIFARRTFLTCSSDVLEYYIPMDNLIEDIRKIARRVCTNQLERLRIEEELLISFIRNSSQNNISTKALALRRIKQINALQIKILGG